VQRFTAGAAIVLLTSAVAIHILNRVETSSTSLDGATSLDSASDGGTTGDPSSGG
jgi:hypothetical protein